LRIKDRIIEILREDKRPPMYIEQLMEALEIPPSQRKMLQSVLDEMVKDGQIIQTKKKKYALPEKLGYIIGRIQGNPRGFGF
jgi:Exoribonuclease R